MTGKNRDHARTPGSDIRQRDLKLQFFFTGYVGTGEDRIYCCHAFDFKGNLSGMAKRLELGTKLKRRADKPDRLSREAQRVLSDKLGFDINWQEWRSGSAHAFANKYNDANFYNQNHALIELCQNYSGFPVLRPAERSSPQKTNKTHVNEDLTEIRRRHQKVVNGLLKNAIDALPEKSRQKLIELLDRKASTDDTIEIVQVLLADRENGELAARKLHGMHEDQKTRIACNDIVQTLAMYIANEDNLCFLLYRNQTEIPDEHAVGSTVCMELKAATIDEAKPEYMMLKSSSDSDPIGKYAILPETAEMGPGDSSVAEHMERHSFEKFGAFVSLESAEDFLRGRLLKVSNQITLTDKQRQELRAIFNRFRRDPGSRTYYLPKCLAEGNRVEAANQDVIIAHFKQHYPGVRIIPLNPDRRYEELDSYALVISSIPVANNMGG